MVLVSAERHSVPMPHLEQLICTSRWRFLSLAASASTVTVLPNLFSRLLIAVNGFGARFFFDTRLPVPLLVLERTPYYYLVGALVLLVLSYSSRSGAEGMDAIRDLDCPEAETLGQNNTAFYGRLHLGLWKLGI